MGVVCTVYHQQPGSEPVSVDSRFSRWLDTDEQPYLRKLTLAEEWVPLDKGWLEVAGMLVIRNDEAKDQTRIHNPVIEVAIVKDNEGGNWIVPFAFVRPSESAQFEPVCLDNFRLRCLKGQAKCTLALIPK